MSPYEITMYGDITVISCRGRIVLGELDSLRTAARSAIESTSRLVLNLASVPFIDSTGLGMLSVLCVSARKRSGDVKLAAPSAEIREILEVTMLGRIFEVFDSVQDALAAFSKASNAGKHT